MINMLTDILDGLFYMEIICKLDNDNYVGNHLTGTKVSSLVYMTFKFQPDCFSLASWFFGI